MQRSTRIAFWYAIAFVAFLIVPVAFRFQAPWPFPAGFYWQEVLDLLTPLVLIPLSWWLCGLDDERAGNLGRIVFLVLAALWVEGQGMHLAANSIARPWEGAAAPVGALAHYYDEILSHYVWHAAMAGLWALAIVRSFAYPYRTGRFPRRLAIPALVVLGVAWFVVVIESGTGPFDVPFTAVAFAYVLAEVIVRGRRHVEQSPVAAILGGSFGISLGLFVGWAAMWGGSLPQFTEVGWL